MMMTTAIELLFMVASILTALGAAAADSASHAAGRRRARLREQFGEVYLHTLIHNLTNDDYRPFPHAGRRASGMLLAEVVEALCTGTCGYDPRRLRRIAETEGLDRLLLREMRHRGRRRKIRALRLMACIPVGDDIAGRVERLRDRGNRDVRLGKLLVRMNHTPERFVSELERYPEPLTPQGLSEVFAALRCGVVPVEFESMTGSDNRNVKLLGLLVVRHLGAVEAADMLYEHTASPSAEIRHAALLTLSSLRLPLSDPNVVAAVVAMEECDRRRLYRRLVADGYSARALAPLILSEGGKTGRYVERMIRSYKKSIPRPSL